MENVLNPHFDEPPTASDIRVAAAVELRSCASTLERAAFWSGKIGTPSGVRLACLNAETANLLRELAEEVMLRRDP